MSRIYSIGYAAHTPDSLAALLKVAGVEVVADVRANPVSRKKGFSKRQLEGTLAAIGIEYESLRILGIPTADRAAAGGADGWGRLLGEYAASLDATGGRGEAAERLADEARLRPTAVMCLESDLDHCHRKPLSEWIAEKTGLELTHL
ncbi:MAG: DUF488 domain-containing protein [Chloroflexi bacterium]|nr:DUF488 domain-containing protein [Chloroflexota bacterium]